MVGKFEWVTVCRAWMICFFMACATLACGEPPRQPDMPSSAEMQSLPPDMRCQEDADCVVKNVGNCCGYFPKCVNRAATVDPEGVKRLCEEQGRSSVCGFSEIQACTCQNNLCQAAPNPGGLLLQ